MTIDPQTNLPRSEADMMNGVYVDDMEEWHKNNWVVNFPFPFGRSRTIEQLWDLYNFPDDWRRLAEQVRL